MEKSRSRMGCNEQHSCSEIAMSDSPTGEKGLNRTLTQSVGICDTDLRVSLGVLLGAEPGEYKSPKIQTTKPESI